jgi:EpsI family protein
LKTPTLVAFASTIVLLAGTILLSGLTARRIPESLRVPLDEITRQISGWTAVQDLKVEDSTLGVLKATAYLSRTYRKGPSELNLFIAFYAQQRAGETMHSPKHCLPGAGWEIWRQDSAQIPMDGKRVQINQYSIENTGQRMLMFYWYQSKDRIIANEYLGKLLLARDTLMTGHTAGSIVRIILPDTADFRNEGMGFAANVIPQVQRCFGSGQPATAKLALTVGD